MGMPAAATSIPRGLRRSRLAAERCVGRIGTGSVIFVTSMLRKVCAVRLIYGTMML
jgi:hypothetical protein